MISLAVLAAGWVVVLSPGDYAILKFPPLSRHSQRFPLDTLGTEAANTFVDNCRRQLSEHGLFNLEGFLRPATLERCVREVKPLLDSAAFVHKRRHNIYFDDRPTELADNHPALKQFETINHTICADQIPGSLICRIYEWPPLATFLAAVLDKTELHLMADPLARVNVIAYRAGEALNWHFDRSEFTTTLILQSRPAAANFSIATRFVPMTTPTTKASAGFLREKMTQ